MKKCQTEKEIMSLENKKGKKTLNMKTIISKIPKIPKIILHIPLNNPNIDIQKNHKKIFTSFLMNNSYTISNENTSPNFLLNSLNNSHRTKIYQKKKIINPQKEKEENKKYIYSLKKKLSLNTKDNNFKNLIKIRKNNNTIITNTESQKYFLNDSKITHQIKKYINNKLNLDEGTSLNTDRYKRININNININLNSINNITNRIEYGEINNNLNTSRSIHNKINDIHFLKKLNFDQPKENKNINHFNEITSNNQNKIINRIKHKKNFIYKNGFKTSKNKVSDQAKILNKLILNIKGSKLSKGKKSKSFKKSFNHKKENNNLNKNKNKNVSLSNNNFNKKNKKIIKIESNLVTSES